MSVIQTVLVFVGIPLGAALLLALLVFGPSAARSPRYKPGREWPFQPVWYIPHPDLRVSGAGRDALPSANRPALPSGATEASQVTTTTDRVKGGAHGTW